MGNISGHGNGSCQAAAWHLSGTNGSNGPFDCDVAMTTTELAARIIGQAVDGEMHIRFALEDAREANEETYCGAGFYGFASDDTRLARSLELVQPPEGLDAGGGTRTPDTRIMIPLLEPTELLRRERES